MAEALKLGVLQVSKVELARMASGANQIRLTLAQPTGFPTLDSGEPILTAEVPVDKTEEWLQAAFGWEKGDPRYGAILAQTLSK